MGRTIPSFRIVIAQEKAEWKTFRNALDKPERKEFDQMWDIPRLYVSACSNSVQMVPLQRIMISILFHHYKDIREVEALGAKINDRQQEQEEENKEKELVPIPANITLEVFFMKTDNSCRIPVT